MAFSPIKAVKAMGGDSVMYQSRCEGGPVGTYRPTKLPNGIGYTHFSDTGLDCIRRWPMSAR